MSTPPPDVVEYQRTERGLVVWFDVEEKIALGSILTPGERAHVADARDRLARARRSS